MISEAASRRKKTIVDAILYVEKSGCQWLMLPKDIPSWKKVYGHFNLWNKQGLWGDALDKPNGLYKLKKIAAHKLSLSVQYAAGEMNLPTRQQFRRWIKAALQRDVQVVLRIVDEIEGRALNKQFRGKDYATNVLTFVYADTVQPPDDADLLYGDIVICAPVVEQEAREQRKDLQAHYAHLAIHAALHLQGYDHENEQDASAMEALETKLLAKLGYVDPYKVAV